jgi:hypothetical protein
MSTTQAIVAQMSHLPQRRLWFGMTAGAFAWSLHLLACVIVTRLACSGRYGNYAAPSVTEAYILLGILSALLFALTVVAGVISFRNWRAVSQSESFLKAEATGREQYMSLIGVFLSVTLGLGILWAGLGILLVNMCVWTR